MDVSSGPRSSHARAALEIGRQAEIDLASLVAISSPFGDRDAAEEAVQVAIGLLPQGSAIERLPCSSPGMADDLLATLYGSGRVRILLLGHLDTVVPHSQHQPLRRDGEHLIGSGSIDMKGGDAIAIGIMRLLASEPQRFAEVTLLLVVDEEHRTGPLAHVVRFTGFDACLCFEGGERTADGAEGVVVRRKAASALRIRAHGRAAHAGSAPDAGANALLALSEIALSAARRHAPDGPAALSVVPSVIHAGHALNVVPGEGELLIDMRAADLRAFDAVTEAIPEHLGEVRLETEVLRSWPGMDSARAAEPLLAAAATRLGRELRGVPRGGASDASHIATVVPLTVDGLGPRGGEAHAPGEYVIAGSLPERAEVALAIIDGLLD